MLNIDATKTSDAKLNKEYRRLIRIIQRAPTQHERDLARRDMEPVRAELMRRWKETA